MCTAELEVGEEQQEKARQWMRVAMVAICTGEEPWLELWGKSLIW